MALPGTIEDGTTRCACGRAEHLCLPPWSRRNGADAIVPGGSQQRAGAYSSETRPQTHETDGQRRSVGTAIKLRRHRFGQAPTSGAKSGVEKLCIENGFSVAFFLSS